MILMVAFFLVLPVLPAVLEYRAARTSKKRGTCPLAGVVALSAFMPAYAIHLGTILLITCGASLRKAAEKQT